MPLFNPFSRRQRQRREEREGQYWVDGNPAGMVTLSQRLRAPCPKLMIRGGAVGRNEDAIKFRHQIIDRYLKARHRQALRRGAHLDEPPLRGQRHPKLKVLPVRPIVQLPRSNTVRGRLCCAVQHGGGAIGRRFGITGLGIAAVLGQLHLALPDDLEVVLSGGRVLRRARPIHAQGCGPRGIRKECGVRFLDRHFRRID